MRTTIKKFFKLGNGLRGMLAVGLGKKGPYVYGGVKHTPSGLSTGASIGSQGRNIYGSVNKRGAQVGAKFKVESKSFSPRFRHPRKLFRR